MTDEFQLLRDLLAGRAATDHTFETPAHRRLLAAIAGSGAKPPTAGPGDLAVLLRQVLRSEQERQSGGAPAVRVPATSPWPRPEEWDLFGLDLLRVSDGYCLLQPRSWRPPWLDGADGCPPDRVGFAEPYRRDYGPPLMGDPFLDPLAPWQHYRSAGQREAIRSLLTAPPGATLVANLPTGSGKSLCAHLPGLLDRSGMTVVTVPTTALALDQERSLRRFITHPTAYYAGNEPRAAERNAGIRDRIRRGEQRIVFASPESVTGPLAAPLYAAAKDGYLRTLAVDEAHVVDQWGDEFRSAFQELAGLRRDLLRAARTPFLTLLLSGTLTESALDTLETLFGLPGPFAAVSAAQLRPEPAYWVAPCADEPEREGRVLEALRHLPRPLLLYVSRVGDAPTWAARLRGAGFFRTAVVTGRTPTPERDRVVQGWVVDEIDVVVATSAFGLGMDKADVRAVVHACVPEHIDRLYQEVGRAGRDGRGCVSLLLHTPADRTTAQSLSKRLIISAKKGFARWSAMFASGEVLADRRQRVRLDVLPAYRAGSSLTRRDVAWNARTLTLLGRAGILELDAEPPPRREADQPGGGADEEDRFRAELDRHRHRRVVRVLNERHLEYDHTWGGRIDECRRATNRATRRGLELVLEGLKGARCLSEVFAEAYTIPARFPDRLAGVVPSRSCGGCPACRRAGRGTFIGVPPVPMPVWASPPGTITPQLAGAFAGASALALFDPQVPVGGSVGPRRERVVQWFVANGVRCIVAPPAVLDSLRGAVCGVPAARVFFESEWQPLFLPRVPTIVIAPDVAVPPAILPAPWRAAGEAGREQPRVLWLAADAADPAKPHCRLRDTLRTPGFSFDEFCTRVGL